MSEIAEFCEETVASLVRRRELARQAKDFATADVILGELLKLNIILRDGMNITSSWYERPAVPEPDIKKDSQRKSKYMNKNLSNRLKKNRFQVFACWIRDMFLMFESPTCFIDVAGGKGKLALELCCFHKFHCTVVDPKISQFSEFTSKRLLKEAIEYASTTELSSVSEDGAAVRKFTSEVVSPELVLNKTVYESLSQVHIAILQRYFLHLGKFLGLPKT